MIAPFVMACIAMSLTSCEDDSNGIKERAVACLVKSFNFAHAAKCDEMACLAIAILVLLRKTGFLWFACLLLPFLCWLFLLFVVFVLVLFGKFVFNGVGAGIAIVFLVSVIGAASGAPPGFS